MSEHLHNIVSKDNDTLDFYLHFLKKSARGTPNLLRDKPEPAETNSLLVIDMQDDFVLPPPAGRFSVTDGVKMAPKLAKFIRECLKNPSFTKVIFSRDTHDVEHCSFTENNGPFPTHCVANHQGARMHESMVTEEMKKAYSEHPDKVDVIFKGCDQHTDSFGAITYPDDEYSRKRQIGEGCKLNSEETGGRYLKDEFKDKKFDDYPFSPGIKECETDKPDKETCSDATGENVKKQLGKKFTIKDLLPEERSTARHNIYIAGLAGDFCVKDTAINLMKAAAERPNIKVYVLQPFVRSAFLPLQLIHRRKAATEGESKNNKETRENTLNTTNFFNTTKGKGTKDITNYVFKTDSGLKLLTKNEVDKLKNEAIDWKKSDFLTAKTMHPYCAFITSTDDIIRDFKNNNVKILMNVPNFNDRPEWRGGSRRRRGQGKRSTRRH